MRLVPIEAVREESFLGKSIYDDEGRLLLREGVILTSKLIQEIRSTKIFTIYVKDEYSEGEIEDVIKPELRQKAVRVIKDTFIDAERFISSFGEINALDSKRRYIALKRRSSYFQSILDIVDIKNMDSYTYQHSVNVAIISLIIGIQLELSRAELNEICLGALVHDVGKMFTPKEIIQKKDKLNPQEMQIMKEHSKKGFEYVHELPHKSRLIVLEHHERVDGTGYPDAKSSRRISQYAKIVAVADVYDALTSDRTYRKAMLPNDAIEYIMANSGSQFDHKTVQAFIHVVVPYSNGTLVKLSSGEVAVVEKTLPFFPLRPVVKILKSNENCRIHAIVNMTEDLNIVISEVVYSLN